MCLRLPSLRYNNCRQCFQDINEFKVTINSPIHFYILHSAGRRVEYVISTEIVLLFNDSELYAIPGDECISS